MEGRKFISSVRLFIVVMWKEKTGMKGSMTAA